MNIISSSMWSIFLCKVYFFILVCENWQALCLYSNLKPDSSYTVENDHICTHRLSSRESIRLSHFPSHVVNIILWQEGSQVQNLSAESIRDFFTVNSLPLRKIGLIHRSIKEDRLFYVTTLLGVGLQNTVRRTCPGSLVAEKADRWMVAEAQCSRSSTGVFFRSPWEREMGWGTRLKASDRVLKELKHSLRLEG